ncbi:hypothetical protein OAA91_00465 [Fibrobacterales bacterium]|nr:hypothetical protein [Fibrobacterales bacterium]
MIDRIQYLTLFTCLVFNVSCSDKSTGTTTETTNGLALVKGNVFDSSSIVAQENSLIILKKIQRKNNQEKYSETVIDSSYSDSQGYFEFELPLNVEDYSVRAQKDSIGLIWQVLGKRSELKVEAPSLRATLQKTSSLELSYDWPNLPFKKDLLIVGTGIVQEADSTGSFSLSGIPAGAQEVILRLYNSEKDSYSHVVDTLLNFTAGEVLKVSLLKPPYLISNGDSLWLDQFEDGDTKNERQSTWYYFDDRREGGNSELASANEGTWLADSGYQGSEGSAAFTYKLKNEPFAYAGMGVLLGSENREQTYNLENLKYVKLMIKGTGKFKAKVCLDGGVFPLALCSDMGTFDQENIWIGKVAGNVLSLVDWSETLKNKGIQESELLKVATVLSVVISPDGEDSQGEFSVDDIRLIAEP